MSHADEKLKDSAKNEKVYFLLIIIDQLGLKWLGYIYHLLIYIKFALIPRIIMVLCSDTDNQFNIGPLNITDQHKR